jgi:DNA-directed RNA polymerase sigma subunit (sigma70/sigma32)
MVSRRLSTDAAPVDQLTLRGMLATPPLSYEREQELARSARAGSADARDDLIRFSLRLVAMRVRHLGIPANEIDDALQAGTVGLIGAVDRFDPDRGVRLSTFAWPWITASIRSTMASSPGPGGLEPPPSAPRGDLDPLVARLPIRLAEVVRLRFRLGEPADALRTHADVAARLGLTVAQVRRAETQALGRLRVRLARLGDRDPL